MNDRFWIGVFNATWISAIFWAILVTLYFFLT